MKKLILNVDENNATVDEIKCYRMTLYTRLRVETRENHINQISSIILIR